MTQPSLSAHVSTTRPVKRPQDPSECTAASELGSLSPALAGSKGPTSETVSNVLGVATSASQAVVEVIIVDRTTVVHSGGGVPRPRAIANNGGSLLMSLHQAISMLSTLCSVSDHLQDLVLRTRIHAGAHSGTIVGLHQSGVDNTLIHVSISGETITAFDFSYVVGGGSSSATFALLDNYGKNESTVNASLSSNLVDSATNAVDLLFGVVHAPAVPATGLAHQGDVGVPELLPRAPSILVRPASSNRSVSLVAAVRIYDTFSQGRPGGRKSGDNANKGESSESDSVHVEKIGK